LKKQNFESKEAKVLVFCKNEKMEISKENALRKKRKEDKNKKECSLHS